VKKTLIICLALAVTALFATQFAADAKASTHSAWYDDVQEAVCYAATDTAGAVDSFFVEIDTVGYIGAAFFVDTLGFSGGGGAGGEADTACVSIYCRGEGSGSVIIQIWDLAKTTVVAKFQFCFTNDAELNIEQYICGTEKVPTLTQWGLIIFAGLLVLTMIFVLRRKRAKLPTPA
jgi:hypothetical protein